MTKQLSKTKPVIPLAALLALRMLGVFIILPVFSAHASIYQGATPTLIGLTLGIYGFSQAALQMPFGAASDRIGRKSIIIIGLGLFIIGSIWCALSHSIYQVIIGRAIQGMGAIGSTTLALIADLTPDQHRSKAMALVGFAISLSFIISMLIAPLVNSYFNLAGVFWLTAIMGITAMLLLLIAVPKSPKLIFHQDIKIQSSQLKNVLRNKALIRLDFSIFTLHAILTTTFIAIPIIFVKQFHLSSDQQLLSYLIVLVLSFAAAIMFIIMGEKKRQLRIIFIAAVTTITLVQLILAQYHQSFIILLSLLMLFFIAFTTLEAILPSLVSKIAPLRNKGSALGIYSCSQFLGIFVGGSLGGVIYHYFDLTGLFIFATIMGSIWLISAISMTEPPYLSTLILNYPDQQPSALCDRLKSLAGVYDVATMAGQNLIYVKIDKNIILDNELRNQIEQGNL